MEGLKVKIARIRAGIRQYELAARLGITQSKLSEIETGRREASPELIARILEAIEEGESATSRKG